MDRKTGVIWVRVSTKMQDQGYSKDYQLQECSKAAQDDGINIIREFKITETAYKYWRRTEFDSMIRYVEENKIDYLIIYVVDRLTRSVRNLVPLYDLIEDHNVILDIVQEHLKIHKNSTPEEWDRFESAAVRAAYESRKIGSRTAKGMEAKARQGIPPGPVPLGYLNAPDPADPSGRKRTVIVEPQRALLIKKAFELYAQGGWSIATLTVELNRLGLRAKKGNKISEHLVEKMLGNSFYWGLFKSCHKFWPGKYEKIVSEELFNQVQEQKHLNCSYSRHGAKKYYPFKPFLKCGYCGCSITAGLHPGRHNGNYVYYHCTRSKDKQCPQKYYRQEDIDKIFADALGEIYIGDRMAEEIEDRLRNDHERRSTSGKKALTDFRKRLTTLENEIELMYGDRLRGTITPEEYKKRSDSHKTEIKRIRFDIEKLGKENPNYKVEVSAIFALLRDFPKIYIESDDGSKVRILSSMLQKVILKKDDARFIWKQPFDYLFDISRILKRSPESQVVKRNIVRGE